MENNIEIKALFPASTDIVSLWNKIYYRENCHLGGENSNYTLSFIGPVTNGIHILKAILSFSEYEVTIKAAKTE